MVNARVLALGSIIALAAACGPDDGGIAGPVNAPSGTIYVAPTGLAPFQTSLTNRYDIVARTSAAFMVTETGYSGNFTATITGASTGAGSGCIAVSPSSSPSSFTINTAAGSTCVYPQTADIQFSDSYGNATTFFVQAG